MPAASVFMRKDQSLQPLHYDTARQLTPHAAGPPLNIRAQAFTAMAREAFASGARAMGPDPNDPFEILGIGRGSRKMAPEDLRAAFRQRAKEAHPDKGGDAN